MQDFKILVTCQHVSFFILSQISHSFFILSQISHPSCEKILALPLPNPVFYGSKPLDNWRIICQFASQGAARGQAQTWHNPDPSGPYLKIGETYRLMDVSGKMDAFKNSIYIMNGWELRNLSFNEWYLYPHISFNMVVFIALSSVNEWYFYGLV